MSRAFDAPLDAGDDYPESGQYEAGPGDAEAAALASAYVTEYEQQIGALDGLEALDDDIPDGPPSAQRGDRPEGASGEDRSDVPRDTSLPTMRNRDSLVSESLRETVDAAEQWAFEKALEFMADAVHPGAGRLISLSFMIKEAFSDAEALTSPESPRNLRVPLLHVAGGMAVDLNVHLRGSDEPADDAPLVSGFLSPGHDGLFGGWEMEVERPSETAPVELAPKQEAIFQAAEQAAAQAPERADRPRRPALPASLVIAYDLSSVAQRVHDPRRRAVVLREAASRLRTRLYARPELAAEPLLVIYDPLAGLGMWLIQPDLFDVLAARRIEIRLNLVTGTTIVLIE